MGGCVDRVSEDIWTSSPTIVGYARIHGPSVRLYYRVVGLGGDN